MAPQVFEMSLACLANRRPLLQFLRAPSWRTPPALIDSVKDRRELVAAIELDEIGVELAISCKRGVDSAAGLDLAEEIEQRRRTKAVQLRNEALAPDARSCLRRSMFWGYKKTLGVKRGFSSKSGPQPCGGRTFSFYGHKPLLFPS